MASIAWLRISMSSRMPSPRARRCTTTVVASTTHSASRRPTNVAENGPSGVTDNDCTGRPPTNSRQTDSTLVSSMNKPCAASPSMSPARSDNMNVAPSTSVTVAGVEVLALSPPKVHGDVLIVYSAHHSSSSLLASETPQREVDRQLTERDAVRSKQWRCSAQPTGNYFFDVAADFLDFAADLPDFLAGFFDFAVGFFDSSVETVASFAPDVPPSISTRLEFSVELPSGNGTRTFITPSSYVAVTASTSTPSGSDMVRRNRPVRRSVRYTPSFSSLRSELLRPPMTSTPSWISMSTSLSTSMPGSSSSTTRSPSSLYTSAAGSKSQPSWRSPSPGERQLSS